MSPYETPIESLSMPRYTENGDVLYVATYKVKPPYSEWERDVISIMAKEYIDLYSDSYTLVSSEYISIWDRFIPGEGVFPGYFLNFFDYDMNNLN
jgi:hypothetical protein